MMGLGLAVVVEGRVAALWICFEGAVSKTWEIDECERARMARDVPPVFF